MCGEFMKRNIIYMDNAATTRMNPRAFNAMLPYYEVYYGNPSSVYQLGIESAVVLREAREVFAKALNCNPEEIYFTSGGSESDNWVLEGMASNYKNAGKDNDGFNRRDNMYNANYRSRYSKGHIITSSIEHHAIINKCKALEKEGFVVTYIEPDKQGIISADKIRQNIRRDTILISVMTANNEVGTIQNITEIGHTAKMYGVPFHTDAVQAFGHIPIDVKKSKIDFLSISGHKFGGPKGVGVLYISENMKIPPMIYGGRQENGMRAGTENVAAIKAMSVAAAEAVNGMRDRGIKLTKMRDYMIDLLKDEVPGVKLNGHHEYRLPNNINISIKNVNAESMVVMLDSFGVCISTGSACSSKSKKPSHVLIAMGIPEKECYESVRLTISENITYREINYVVGLIKKIVYDIQRD